MRRVLLLITGFGAGTLMFCLLLMNVSASLERTANAPRSAPEKRVSSISFPYTVQGTNLIIERAAAYDGPFLENSSNKEMVNVTAIVLRNAGFQGIEKATIVLEQEGRRLSFEAETIPPGSAVLVLEKNGSEYIQKIYNTCSGEQTLSEEVWWSQKPPKVKPEGMGTLAVTNDTEDLMENVWLYYKTYQEDLGIYIGGITYKVGIRKLKPGQTLEINPPNYANGYSRIARITTG